MVHECKKAIKILFKFTQSQNILFKLFYIFTEGFRDFISSRSNKLVHVDVNPTEIPENKA